MIDPLLNDWPGLSLLEKRALNRQLAAMAETGKVTAVTSPVEFRQRLLIHANGIARPFAEVMDGWQREDFEAADAAWRWVAEGGQPDPRPLTNFYLERSKGHSKTTDFAVMISWALYASPRKLLGLAVAGDKDQAKLLRDGVDTLLRTNPWLFERIKISNYEISNPATGSVCQVMAADAHTSHGPTPDFVIIDEITNWKTNLQAFFESIYAGTAKRTPCVCVVIANAGLGEGTSWQWRVREAARESARWYFHHLKGFQASWLDRRAIYEEQGKFLTNAAFARLWLNQWSGAEGDALDPEDVLACITQSGPMQPRSYYERKSLGDWTFIAGVDIGVKHDHSALVVIGVQYGNPKLVLALCREWTPGKKGRVDLRAVEQGILEAHARYRFSKLLYDPQQAEAIAQNLTRAGIWTEEMNFVGRNLNDMASTIVETFRTHMVDLYNCPELIRDLKRLVIVQNSFGLKLEAPATADGHADTAFALAIALPEARSRAHATAFLHEPMQRIRVDSVGETGRHGVQFDRGHRERRMRG